MASALSSEHNTTVTARPSLEIYPGEGLRVLG